MELAFGVLPRSGTCRPPLGRLCASFLAPRIFPCEMEGTLRSQSKLWLAPIVALLVGSACATPNSSPPPDAADGPSDTSVGASDAGADATTPAADAGPPSLDASPTADAPSVAQPDAPAAALDAAASDTGPNCAATCAPGDQRCNGANNPEVCSVQSGCPAWGSAGVCGTPKLCVMTGAMATCTCPTGGCALNTKQCGPNSGVQTCQLMNDCAVWSPEQPCTSPANGTAVCKSSACTTTCNGAFLSCTDGTCQTSTRSFEDGTVQGVHVNTAVTSNYSKALRSPLYVKPFQSSNALAADVQFDSTLHSISLLVPFCPGTATTAVRGKPFTASIYVDGPTPSNGSMFSAAASIPVGFLVGARSAITPGATFPLVGTIPDGDESDTVTYVEIGITLLDGANLTPWQGTIYLDDIKVGN